MLAGNIDNIRVYGSEYDRIYLAPIGTPDPDILSAADMDADLGEPYDNVGWLADDGIPFSVSTDVEKFKAHQGGKQVRVKVTSTEQSFTIAALEESPLVTGLFYDHGAPTKVGTDLARVDISGSIGTVARKAVVIVGDDKNRKAVVISRIEIGEREDVPHALSEISGYTMTAEITGEMYWLTNSKSYVDAATVVPGP